MVNITIYTYIYNLIQQTQPQGATWCVPCFPGCHGWYFTWAIKNTLSWSWISWRWTRNPQFLPEIIGFSTAKSSEIQSFSKIIPRNLRFFPRRSPEIHPFSPETLRHNDEHLWHPPVFFAVFSQVLCGTHRPDRLQRQRWEPHGTL